MVNRRDGDTYVVAVGADRDVLAGELRVTSAQQRHHVARRYGDGGLEEFDAPLDRPSQSTGPQVLELRSEEPLRHSRADQHPQGRSRGFHLSQ